MRNFIKQHRTVLLIGLGLVVAFLVVALLGKRATNNASSGTPGTTGSNGGNNGNAGSGADTLVIIQQPAGGTQAPPPIPNPGPGPGGINWSLAPGRHVGHGQLHPVTATPAHAPGGPIFGGIGAFPPPARPLPPVPVRPTGPAQPVRPLPPRPVPVTPPTGGIGAFPRPGALPPRPVPAQPVRPPTPALGQQRANALEARQGLPARPGQRVGSGRAPTPIRPAPPAQPVAPSARQRARAFA